MSTFAATICFTSQRLHALWSDWRYRLLAGMVGLLLFCLTAAPEARAIPVSVEKVANGDNSGVYLAESAFFLPDPLAEYGIEQAGSPLLQNRYRRLSEGLPLTAEGGIWLRFSLVNSLTGTSGNATGSAAPSGRAAAEETVRAAQTSASGKQIALLLQEGSPAARVYVARELGSNGEVRRWREIPALANGAFLLPDPGRLPLTVYVKLDAMPGLWFNPTLVGVSASGTSSAPAGFEDTAPAGFEDSGAAGESASSDAIGDTLNQVTILPLILQLVLGGCLALCLLRGISRREEWRLWAGAIIACALMQAIFYHQAPGLNGIYLSTLPGLLAPGLAIMLMPHLGRHLLGSSICRPLDIALILLSLPGMAAALAPLLPGLAWTAKLLPLAPLLLLPPALIPLGILLDFILNRRGNACGSLLGSGDYGSLLNRRSNACAYLLFCLPPLAGAALALIGLAEARIPAAALEQAATTLAGTAALSMTTGLPGDLSGVFAAPLYLYGPDLTICGYALSALFMTLVSLRPGQSTLTRSRQSDGASQTGKAGKPESTNKSVRTGMNGQKENRSLELFTVPAAQTGQAGQRPEYNLNLPDEPSPSASERAAGLFAGQSGDTVSLFAGQPGETAGDLFSVGKIRVPLPQETADDLFEEDTINPVDMRDLISDREASDREALDREALDKDALNTNVPNSDALAEKSGTGPVLAESFDSLRQNLEELKQQQNNAESMTDNLEEILHGLGQALDNLDSLAHGKLLAAQPEQSIFNLSSLVRSVHATVLPLAEERGVALAWFVSPLLPILYKGDEDALRSALTYMLRGSVEAAEAGAVQLAVRQARPAGNSDSVDQAEHVAEPVVKPVVDNGMIIQFSLIDCGMSPQSLRRPARVLSRAWELARASQGSFSIEFAPSSGTSIHFSLCLVPLLDRDNAWAGDAKLDDLASRAENLDATATETAMLTEEMTLVTDPDDEDLLLAVESMDAMPAEADQPTDDPADEDLLLLTAAESTPESWSIDLTDTDEAEEITPSDAEPELAPEPEPEQKLDTEAELAPEPEQEHKLDTEAEEIVPPDAEPELVPAPEPEQELDAEPELVPEPGETLLDGQALAFAPKILTERDSIVIVDLAASGRRIISRRLEGLPRKHLEVASCREIVSAAAGHKVALIIVDADIPEADLRAALYAVNAAEAASGRPPVPSLGLVSHFSQSARLSRAGCTVCQVKTESREDFQREVMRLAPWPEAASTPETIPAASRQIETPSTAMSRQIQTAVDLKPVPDASGQIKAAIGLNPIPAKSAPEPGVTNQPEHLAATRPDRSIPMLDLIVSGLDAESPEAEGADEHAAAETVTADEHAAVETVTADEHAAAETVTADENREKILLAGAGNEYMDAAMLRHLPDFLVVLKETLVELAAAVRAGEAEQVSELAGRMEKQGSSYGLNNLERMAACVKRAADAGDQEAIRDLAEELMNLVRRYLPMLRITYDDHLKAKQL